MYCLSSPGVCLALPPAASPLRLMGFFPVSVGLLTLVLTLTRCAACGSWQRERVSARAWRRSDPYCLETLLTLCHELQLAAGEGVGEGLAAESAAAAAFGVARGVGDASSALWLNGALTLRPAGVRWQQLLGFAVQMEQQRLQVR